MEAAGVRSVASIDELSVMGVAEVAAQIGRLALLEKRVLASIERLRPAFVITVDFPGFHFRLAGHLKLAGIPVYQYVAPKLWAWGAGRVSRLKQDFAGVLGILPFESEFFLSRDVNYEYVGCPHVDRVRHVRVDRAMFGFEADKNTQPIVLLLPGSRRAEIESIAPLLRRVARQLEVTVPGVAFALPVASNLPLDFVRSRFSGIRNLRVFHGCSLELMSIADAAVVASGTATLECGLSMLPMVVVYEVSPLTYSLMKNHVTIKHVSLVNLVAGHEVVPEFIQNVDPVAVAMKVEKLLLDPASRESQMRGLRMVNEGLQGGAAMRAALAIKRWSPGVGPDGGSE